jgi:hypothetical protein
LFHRLLGWPKIFKTIDFDLGPRVYFGSNRVAKLNRSDANARCVCQRLHEILTQICRVNSILKAVQVRAVFGQEVIKTRFWPVVWILDMTLMI